LNIAGIGEKHAQKVTRAFGSYAEVTNQEQLGLLERQLLEGWFLVRPLPSRIHNRPHFSSTDFLRRFCQCALIFLSAVYYFVFVTETEQLPRKDRKQARFRG
jgi:hypothetical protein